MRRAIKLAITTAAACLAAAPAYAAVTPSNDPCSYGFVNGAIACQGYYGGNLITGSAGSATTQAQLDAINLLLTGTPSMADTTPTTNGPTYTGVYPSLTGTYGTVLGSLANLNGASVLNFGSLNLSGLTILGAHFGNNTDSDPNNITAFWLVDLGSSVTHTINLSSGAGSSNAQVFSTGTPGVPEPATWAMMLLGFAGIGVTMRRSAPRTALMQIA